MHNPVTEQDNLTFDFGATDLGTSFHRDWSNCADTALDHIAQRYGAEGDPTPVILLIEDLLRLEDSGLSGEEISLLWYATDISLGAPGIPGKEREWVQEVLSCVVPIARSRGASAASCSTYPACVPDGTSAAAAEHRRMTADVVGLVGMLDQRQSWSYTPLAPTRRALVRCAETVCSELAFRFLLCATGPFCSRLSPATYERLERVSAAFGHGPYVVSAVRYLVDEPRDRP
ncbi:hypothetical protein ACFWUW_22080 [Streptomyces sp. NPDC058655]|uniref:hypothetical protein n=1 Tax=unclassified Streptomyces TaxID=2593676 RepID=UPI003653EA07